MNLYRERPIRFLELWQPTGWRIKVYGIAHGRPTPRRESVDAAKVVAEARLTEIPKTTRHYSVGFLGIDDGRTANFVFVDWWADENELHHHVYVSPTNEPASFTYATPTGLVGCVWDLRLMAFERQAWVDSVLQPPDGPDFEAYLRQTLNEDA